MRKTILSSTTAGLAVGLLFGLLAQPSKKSAKHFLNVGGERPPGYTHVVTSPPGRMIYISGQGGTADDGKMPPDFNTQARNTFESLKRCLALAGASFKDVVKINYFVTDMANTAELRRVRSEYIDMERPPASTLVQSGLGTGMLLEIEAVAIVPE